MIFNIVTAENIGAYQCEMEQAYRLRHNVFVDEMGWEDLRKPDGREIDQFDEGAHSTCSTSKTIASLDINGCCHRCAHTSSRRCFRTCAKAISL